LIEHDRFVFVTFGQQAIENALWFPD